MYPRSNFIPSTTCCDCRVYGVGFGIQGFKLRVYGEEFMFWGVGVQGVGSRPYSLDFAGIQV
jgi:hypothetical protein